MAREDESFSDWIDRRILNITPGDEIDPEAFMEQIAEQARARREAEKAQIRASRARRIDALQRVLRYTQDPQPERVLRAIRMLRKHLDRIEIDAVAEARKFGWSWQAIGRVMGVSRQTVYERFHVPGSDPDDRTIRRRMPQKPGPRPRTGPGFYPAYPRFPYEQLEPELDPDELPPPLPPEPHPDELPPPPED